MVDTIKYLYLNYPVWKKKMMFTVSRQLYNGIVYDATVFDDEVPTYLYSV